MTTERRLGNYTLLRPLGKGGQGIVWLANDERLNRRVAVKVLSSALSLSDSARQRFLREAEIASRLDHPDICTIFEIGEDDGAPWIAMQYVEGDTLARRIAEARSTPEDEISYVDLSQVARDAEGEPETVIGADRLPVTPTTDRDSVDIKGTLALIERTARALHAAHEEGLIHRDIKPGNVMVTPDGRPVILDFGLARDESSAGPTLTQTGDVMGTPAYMSPEQLVGSNASLDRRADVYALGVTAFECLTLQRPFDAPTRQATYKMILDGDTSKPSALNPLVSRDLDVVIRTAMERDRERRYETALAFAEDLHRVLTFQPILARPAGLMLRFKRWSQRNPGFAVAVVCLFFIMAAGLAGLAWSLRKERDNAAELRRRDAEQKATNARLREANREKDRALKRAEALTLISTARSLLGEDPGVALALALEGSRRHRSEVGNTAILAALDQTRLDRTLVEGDSGIVSAVFDSAGRRVFSYDDSHTVRVHDASTGELLRTFAHGTALRDVLPLGEGDRLLTVTLMGRAVVFDVKTGERLVEGARPVAALAGSPGAPVFVTAPGRAARAGGRPAVRDATTGKETGRLAAVRGRVRHVVLSASGHLVAGWGGRAVWVWRTDTHGVVRRLQAESAVQRVVVTANRVAAERLDGRVELWDTTNGERVATLNTGQGIRLQQLAVSADGRHILTLPASRYQRSRRAARGAPVVWRASDGARLATLATDRATLTTAAFSPDGARIAAAASDGSVRLWSAGNGSVAFSLRGHRDVVRSLAFSPDGRRIVTASRDGSVRVWSADATLLPSFRTPSGTVADVVSMPGEELIAVASRGVAVLSERDLILRRLIAPPSGVAVQALAWDPGRRRLAAATNAGKIHLIDVTTGESVKTIDGAFERALSIRFVRDGAWLLVRASSQGASLYDARSGHRLASPADGMRFADFSEDGRQLFVVPGRGRPRLLHLTNRDMRHQEIHHEGLLAAGRFSPDGRMLATVSSLAPLGPVSRTQHVEGRTHLYDIPFAHLGTGGDDVVDAVFDPTSRRLARCHLDGSLSILDLDTRLAEVRPGHREAALTAAFSRDGRWILTGGADDAARLWNAVDGSLAAVFAGHDDDVVFVTFGTDDTRAITVSRDGVVRNWPVDPAGFAADLPMADLPEDERRRLGLTSAEEDR